MKLGFDLVAFLLYNLFDFCTAYLGVVKFSNELACFVVDLVNGDSCFFKAVSDEGFAGCAVHPCNRKCFFHVSKVLQNRVTVAYIKFSFSAETYLKHAVLVKRMKSDLAQVLRKLSPLEADIAKILEKGSWCGARELYRKMKKKRDVAPTSIAVLLDRLYKKGLLERKSETCRGGTRFVYHLQLDRSRYERQIIESVVDKMIKKFGANALNYFNERFAKKR